VGLVGYIYLFLTLFSVSLFLFEFLVKTSTVDLNSTYITEGSLECGASCVKSPQQEILHKIRDIDMNFPCEENSGTNFSFLFF
jgi:hypothetical protein